jgi:hypothetical protein
MRQIDNFRKVIRHMLNSTVFPKPYTHTPTHTGISQRRVPQIKRMNLFPLPRNLVEHHRPRGSVDDSITWLTTLSLDMSAVPPAIAGAVVGNALA